MIEEQFGLTSAPFRLGTDARFYYESEAHRRAMAHLRYGLRLAEGFVVVTGEAGVGKTMLVERLLLDLEGSDVIAAAIQPTGLTPENLPGRVLGAFGRQAGEGDAAEALREVLVMERERGAKASLIIDEAQHLSDDVLEALRLLLNLTHEGEALLQVCLLGQTGLRRVLFRPDMEQFRQRVVASHHLPALNAADTEAYIRHRMRRAGRAEGEELFTEEACIAVFEATGGVPRRINLLGGRALTQAALDGADEIDAPLVRAVASEEGAREASAADEVDAEAAGPTSEPPAAPTGPQESTEPALAPANDDEEAAAERALALVTARTEAPEPGPPVEPGEVDGPGETGGQSGPGERAERDDPVEEAGAARPAGDEADGDEEGAAPLRYAGQLNGGGGAGRYPVTVSEINAAIRSIQTPELVTPPPAAPRTSAPRRFRSPQELMLAKANRQAEATPAPEEASEHAERPEPTAGEGTGGPGSGAEGGTRDQAPASSVRPVDRAALEAFLATVGPTLDELRAALDELRARTDRLDAARRERRARLASAADAAAERLAKLRGE